MTQVNFPSTAGEATDGSFQYTVNGVTYSWNGTYWAANNAAALDNRFVEVAGDTMTGNLNVPSLNGGPLAGMRNALINSSFDIWQRGTAAFSGGGQYTADRWFVASATATTTRVDGPLTEGTGASYALQVVDASSLCEVRQNVEYLLPAARNNPAPFCIGKQYTISGWVRLTAGVNFQIDIKHRAGNTGANESVSFATIFAGTGAWQRFSHTFNMTAPTGGNKICLQVALRSQAAATLSISQVQLEPGPTSTPYEQRPIATELDLSMRYYQVVHISAPGEFTTVTLRPELRGQADVDRTGDAQNAAEDGTSVVGNTGPRRIRLTNTSATATGGVYTLDADFT